MSDPLTQLIQLLKPQAVFSKGISGAGSWAVRYSEFGHPGFCAVTQGQCRLAVDGLPSVIVEEGDFVLLPGTPAFTMSSLEPGIPLHVDPKTGTLPMTEVRYGRPDGPPDMRQFGGYFRFGSPDAGMLVSLLPAMIHVRGNPRLSQLVRLVATRQRTRASDATSSSSVSSKSCWWKRFERSRHRKPNRDC